MRSLALTWPVRMCDGARNWQLRIPAMVITLRDIVAALAALAVVVVSVLLAAWLAATVSGHVLAGGTWGSAIVYLGLAVDGRGPKTPALVLTATALMALAWLQLSVTAGFVVLAALLVAPWPAAAVFRRLQ